jgi:hypothetical protein
VPRSATSATATTATATTDAAAEPPTLFLLSPARCGGERAAQLVRSRRSELGRLLHAHAAPIGEVFAWLSALYFRGKLAYARRFGAMGGPVPGVLVMAPGLGLRAPETQLSISMFEAMGKIEVESPAFVQPLARDAALVARACDPTARIVILGSIATGKYLETLLEVFGERLLFPKSFVGRGDMSRGGLLLRASRTGDELAYHPVAGATLHGARPPKLPPLYG